MGVVAKMLLTEVGLVLLQVISSLCETYEIADDVYSFTTTNAYFSMFVVTGSGVIVIDPSNLEHSKQMLKEINDITSEPVKWVFYSHNHWDHIAGGQVFTNGKENSLSASCWFKPWTRNDSICASCRKSGIYCRHCHSEQSRIRLPFGL